MIFRPIETSGMILHFKAVSGSVLFLSKTSSPSVVFVRQNIVFFSKCWFSIPHLPKYMETKSPAVSSKTRESRVTYVFFSFGRNAAFSYSRRPHCDKNMFIIVEICCKFVLLLKTFRKQRPMQISLQLFLFLIRIVYKQPVSITFKLYSVISQSNLTLISITQILVESFECKIKLLWWRSSFLRKYWQNAMQPL